MKLLLTATNAASPATITPIVKTMVAIYYLSNAMSAKKNLITCACFFECLFVSWYSCFDSFIQSSVVTLNNCFDLWNICDLRLAAIKGNSHFQIGDVHGQLIS